MQSLESSEASPADSPGSPGNGSSGPDVKSRLLGLQSIGRVESSYLRALHAAEGQQTLHADSAELSEPPVSPTGMLGCLKCLEQHISPRLSLSAGLYSVCLALLPHPP